MTKSKYRLQPVVEVRERAKQDAARLVALRRTQLGEAEDELARREQDLDRCRASHRDAQTRMLSEAERGVEARHVVAHRAHVSDLRQREETLLAAVDEQRGAVTRAERELELSLAGLAEASKELRVIDSHRRQWHDGERQAERKREQKVGDEIAATLHGRRRK